MEDDVQENPLMTLKRTKTSEDVGDLVLDTV